MIHEAALGDELDIVCSFRHPAGDSKAQERTGETEDKGKNEEPLITVRRAGSHADSEVTLHDEHDYTDHQDDRDVCYDKEEDSLKEVHIR